MQFFRTGRLPVAWTVLTVMLATWLLDGDSAWAQNWGHRHTARAKGLALVVDCQWVDGPGYLPVRITITPTAPIKADRTINVEFTMRRHAWRPGEDIKAEKYIELPAGSGAVSTTLSVPQLIGASAFAINVYDDGVEEPGLSMPLRHVNTIGNYWREALPTLAFLGKSAPDFSRLASVLPVSNYGGSSSATVPQFPTGMLLSAADLPENWIDYTSLDIFCLSLSELRDLEQLTPAKFDALLRWVAAGGNLWVYGVGEDWEQLGLLEDVLDLPPGTDDGQSKPADRGWTMPDARLYGRPVQGYQQDGRGYGYPTDMAIAVDVVEESTVEPSPARNLQTGPPPAAFRRFDLGMVVALRSDEPFPQPNRPRRNARDSSALSELEWQWILNAAGSNRWLWYQRHGVSMMRPNGEFYNFLIPGVGLAPVTEFLILITLFAVAIGPVNFWLLRRVKRLHLLVVTVPVLSATVTLLLVAYALFSDGLGTRVRARSYTELDQRRGHAASFARLSYYAGLAPGDGLTFPDDVAVQPLDPVPSDYRGRRTLDRQVLWDDEGQHLTGGWLRSRTPTQFIALRSRPTEIGLRVFRADDGSWKVENRLGTNIEQLLVRPDDTELIFSAKDVAAGETVTLAQDGAADLWEAYMANRPTMPGNVNMNRYYTGIFELSRNPMYPYNYGGYDLAFATQTGSLLERSLNEAAVTRGRVPKSLSPRSYIALVESSPEVVPGVDSGEEESSYHVIRGEW